MNALPICLALAVIAVRGSVGLCADPPTTTKTEHFVRDPGWDAHNNRVVPDRPRTVTQDFGYDGKGAVGGRVTRAMKPASCAAVLEKPKTLDDKLSAAGTFALTQTSAGGGAFFGWFNANQPEGSGRPIGSLGLHLDTERGGGRLAIRLITGSNQSAGKFVTRFEPYKTKEEQAEKRPTPLRNDGTRYAWTLSYDPDAAGGNGQVRFTITSDSATPGDFEGKPVTFDLPPGYRQQGATFDRLGLTSGTKPGGVMTIHFDALKHDGAATDLSKWVESGSRAAYEDKNVVGAHDFGFSGATNHAGGAKAGEVGGSLWRGGPYGYYADKVGPLSFDDRLEARGRVVLAVGAPDADMYIGWFDSAAREESPAKVGSFIGVHVGGPTRVGHWFQPAFATAKGNRGHPDTGPVMKQGKTYDWTFVYDPAGNNGNGELRVTLGDESVTLPLKQGLRNQGGTFDRFGLLTASVGGQLVKIYIDDVTYTSSR